MSAKQWYWFPFDVNQWQTSRQVRLMTMAQRGVYITLLCESWRDGHIPADPEELAQLVNMPYDEFAQVWERVSKCFFGADSIAEAWAELKVSGEPPEVPHGMLVNPWLEVKRATAGAIKEERSKAGKAGAQARWGGDKPTEKKQSKAKPAKEPAPKKEPKQPSPEVTTGPFADVKAVFDRVEILIPDHPKHRDSEVRKHLRDDSPIRILVADYGADKAAEMFAWAWANWNFPPTWPAVSTQRAQIVAAMVVTKPVTGSQADDIKRRIGA